MFPVKAATQLIANMRPMARRMSVISGPPTNRVSFVEKCVIGVVFTGSMLIIPAWVLLNIKHYRKLE